MVKSTCEKCGCEFEYEPYAGVENGPSADDIEINESMSRWCEDCQNKMQYEPCEHGVPGCNFCEECESLLRA